MGLDRRYQCSLKALSLSWPGSEQSSPRALVVWALGLLRWALRLRQRTGRPLREAHPEETTALTAKADLLASRVAVDEYAKVTIENEASKLYEASPWAADKRDAEIVRPAPVQSADKVPPKSPARFWGSQSTDRQTQG